MSYISVVVPQNKRKIDDYNQNQNEKATFNWDNYELSNKKTSLKFDYHSDDNICGLEFIVEYRNELLHVPKYECKLCNTFCPGNMIINHAKTTAHFSNYIKTKPNNNPVFSKELRWILCRTFKQHYEENAKKSWLNQITVKEKLPSLSTNPSVFDKNEYALKHYTQTLLDLGKETDLICGLQYLVEYRMGQKRLKYECVLCNCLIDGPKSVVSHFNGTRHFSNYFCKHIEQNDLNHVNDPHFKALFCNNLKKRIQDVHDKSLLDFITVKIAVPAVQKPLESQNKKVKPDVKENNTTIHDELNSIHSTPKPELNSFFITPIKIEPDSQSIFSNVVNTNLNPTRKDNLMQLDENNNENQNKMLDASANTSILFMFPHVRVMFNTGNLVKNQRDLKMAEDFLKKLNNQITSL